MRRTLSVTFRASRSLRGEHYRFQLTMLIDVARLPTPDIPLVAALLEHCGLANADVPDISSSDSTSRSTKRHLIECAAAESHGLDILIH